MNKRMIIGLVFLACLILVCVSAYFVFQHSPVWVIVLIVSSIVGTVAGVKAGIIKIKELAGLLD